MNRCFKLSVGKIHTSNSMANAIKKYFVPHKARTSFSIHRSRVTVYFCVNQTVVVIGEVLVKNLASER